MQHDKVRALALQFEEAVEEPHFHKASFRVRKKIFATLDTQKDQLVLKFTEVEQSVFGVHDPEAIYPVKGKWGQQGWTIVELTRVRPDVLEQALTTSYCNAAPARLSAKYRSNPG